PRGRRARELRALDAARAPGPAAGARDRARRHRARPPRRGAGRGSPRMKIVLVHPPSPDPPPNDFGPPWDMAMAAACLREAGAEVSGLDWGRLPDADFDARFSALMADGPDVVG